MSKAQQAAEERWAALTRGEAFGAPGDSARKRGFVAAYIQGREDALPEEPDPAVIEAIAKAICGRYYGDGSWVTFSPTRLEPFLDHARAAYAAMRGAMQ